MLSFTGGDPPELSVSVLLRRCPRELRGIQLDRLVVKRGFSSVREARFADS